LRAATILFALGLVVAGGVASQQGAAGSDMPTGPGELLRIGSDQTEAIRVHDSIWLALGFSNSFLVTTPEGNIVVDTSLPQHAPRQKRLFEAVSDAPVRTVILTHGHGDHRGGLGVWQDGTVEVIVQRQYEEFRHYQERLRGFFARRNMAQFGGVPGLALLAGRDPSPGNHAADVEATTLFDDRYDLEIGGVKLELHHTPGETQDALSVWIPEWKVAFVGDNFYASFPNIYTLRGTRPRWALDYVASLDKVLSWQPEIVLPSHGMPVVGRDEVQRQLTQYRDAIQHVHDAVVAGMNEGKDVYTLMQEISLPPELEVEEGYGTLSWSVRGIYEGYAGWFDGEAATMYEVPRSSVSDDLVSLAGGVDAVVARARERLAGGEAVEALHLVDVALEGEPDDRTALEFKLEVLEMLMASSENSNEKGWLASAGAQTRQRIAALDQR
jgi:alkyl sulfatase BDS1-like metallo-beta-lactamase superfamily hydrolase